RLHGTVRRAGRPSGGPSFGCSRIPSHSQSCAFIFAPGFCSSRTRSLYGDLTLSFLLTVNVRVHRMDAASTEKGAILDPAHGKAATRALSRMAARSSCHQGVSHAVGDAAWRLVAGPHQGCGCHGRADTHENGCDPLHRGWSALPCGETNDLAFAIGQERDGK